MRGVIKSLWYQSAPLQTNSYRFNKYIENELKWEGSNAKELLRIQPHLL